MKLLGCASGKLKVSKTTMKLGIANSREVHDFDLADTLDVSPLYSEVVYLIQKDELFLAHVWLGMLDRS